MMKMATGCLVLLTVFMVSGCLLDPYDGKPLPNSWEARNFIILYNQPQEEFQMQCQLSNATWQTFAKGKTAKSPVAGTEGLYDSYRLYPLGLWAVVPAACWSGGAVFLDENGNPVQGYKATVRAWDTVSSQALTTLTQTMQKDIADGIIKVGMANWVSVSYQALLKDTRKTSNIATLYTQNHDPYLVHANSWNYVFQQQYLGDGNETERWVRGDGPLMLNLPYCDQCGSQDKYRRFWLVGDSLRSTIGSDGTINTPTNCPTCKIDPAFGNTIRITPHEASNFNLPIVPNPAIQNGDDSFDWNASAAGCNPTATDIYNDCLSWPAWMPWLMAYSQFQSLPELHPLRLAAYGYTNSDFMNGVEMARVHSNQWQGSQNGVPVPNLIPVFEYYSPFFDFNFYTTDRVPNGTLGFAYERVAFWVFRPQKSGETGYQPPTGTIPLYRYYSDGLKDVLLTTSDKDQTGYLGYSDRTVIGYVSDAGQTDPNTVPLYDYFKPHSDNSMHTHHVYTIHAQDNGFNNHKQAAVMWAAGGVIIGNDLLYIITPIYVTSSLWSQPEKSAVAIVKGVNLPYNQWGKAPQGNWGQGGKSPVQYPLESENATITWNKSIVKDINYNSNKYVYVYGSRNTKYILDNKGTVNTNPFNFVPELVVARVSCEKAEDFVNFNNWQYYIGKDINGKSVWDSNQENAIAIMQNILVSSIITHSGAYILMSQGLFAPTIQFYKSTNPEGEFTLKNKIDLLNNDNEKTFLDAKTGYCMTDGKFDGKKCMYYSFNAHPGLSYTTDGISRSGDVEDGLMISFVRTSPMGTDIELLPYKHDPSVYVPRFVDIPWSKILPIGGQ